MSIKNMDRLYEIARKNTKYNSQGHAVISKDDEWIEETEWDEMFNKEVKKDENYTPKRNMVCAIPT